MPAEHRPEPPVGLLDGGRHLWSSMHDELAEGAMFDGRDLELLEAGCRLRDRLDELHERLREDGPVVSGSQGQPVAHPALSAVSAMSAQLRLLLTGISLDPDEVAHGARSVSGRRGANKRWAAERALRAVEG